MAGQGSDGRRITIEKVPKKDKRPVTFSKLRHGLVKKASELVTLHGAHVAIFVISPGRKIYSFAHPCADEVIRRFLGEEPVPEPETQIDRSSVLNQLYLHLNQLKDLVDEEWSKGEEINLERRETEGKVWWERPIEEMNVQQLELLMVKMREFKCGVDEKIRLIQQEEELNGKGHGAMGGGTDGGPVHDPKGKGPAHEVSLDPIAGGSSSRAQLDTRVPGFDGGDLFNPNPSRFHEGGSLDPNASGSSN